MRTVYKWFKWFHNGCESVEDKERLGHPSTSETQENVERVSEMIWSNRQLTIRELSEDLNISYGSENDLRNGQTVSFSIMTTLRVTRTVCPHPPYSQDLAPCDFWLFPKVKMTMKGKRFELIQDIEAATTTQLETFTKEDLQNCFRKWQERWDKCDWSEGEYFEGD
jgi:hypothetical protein